MSTAATTPFHIWKHNTILAAGCSVADVERSGWMPRLSLWYSSGETVDMAAASLRFIVRRQRVEQRSVDEADGLRRILAKGLKND